MRINMLVAQVADPLANIPWGAQLGMVGTLVLIIVGILIRHNRQVQRDAKESIERVIVQKDLEYTRMETLLVGQVAGQTALAAEWRQAHEKSEEARTIERETARAAVQSNRLFDGFMDRFVEEVTPRTGARKSLPTDPTSGDNGAKELTP